LRYKLLAFAVGGFMAGAAGSLYAFYVFSVSPGGFLNLSWTLYPILMCVMGGNGTVLGPVLGAFVMTAVFSAANVWLPGAHPLISGSLIIAVMLFMPQGIVRFRRRIGKEAAKARPAGAAAATPQPAHSGNHVQRRQA
ncbi:MAG: branched-chain amino acid ABC transporter permease, partial [Burkholderiales bacterium]|nr:branched-chain amino acid ABC transporter permease [Burkholderiales bacterium]